MALAKDGKYVVNQAKEVVWHAQESRSILLRFLPEAYIFETIVKIFLLQSAVARGFHS